MDTHKERFAVREDGAEDYINKKPLPKFDQDSRQRLLKYMPVDGVSLSYACGDPILEVGVFIHHIELLGKKFGMDYMHTDPRTNEQSLSRRKMALLLVALHQRGWTNKDFAAAINRMINEIKHPHWRVEDLFRYADTSTVPRVYPPPSPTNFSLHPLYWRMREDYTSGNNNPAIGWYQAFGQQVVGYVNQVGDSLSPVTNTAPHNPGIFMANVLQKIRMGEREEPIFYAVQKIIQLERLIQDQRIQQVEMLQDIAKEISSKQVHNTLFRSFDRYTTSEGEEIFV